MLFKVVLSSSRTMRRLPLLPRPLSKLPRRLCRKTASRSAPQLWLSPPAPTKTTITTPSSCLCTKKKDSGVAAPVLFSFFNSLKSIQNCHPEAPIPIGGGKISTLKHLRSFLFGPTLTPLAFLSFSPPPPLLPPPTSPLPPPSPPPTP